MKAKGISAVCLFLSMLLCVSLALAAENTATATIDLHFDDMTFTDTVQVEWNEQYVVPEGGVKWDGSPEFLFMTDFTNDDLVDCPDNDPYADKYVKNQIAFMGIDGKHFYEIEQIAAKHGAIIIGYLAPTEDYVIEFTTDKSYDELKGIANELKKEQLLLSDTVVLHYAFPATCNYYPSDPWDNATWDENNPNGNNWGVEAIHAPSAWEYLNFMEPLNVGIIDGTFLEKHPDLDFTASYDRVNLSSFEKYKYFIYAMGEVRDNLIHGTHVAGTFAAIHDNNIGVSGVFPKGNLIGIGSFYQDIDTAPIEDIIVHYNTNTSMPLEKFRFLIMRRENVRVINVSIGRKWTDEEINIFQDQDAVNQSIPLWTHYYSIDMGMNTFFDRINELNYDFVLVNSAGNDAIDCAMNWWPEWISNSYFQDRLIVAGSYRKNVFDNDYSFSNQYNYGSRLDVIAPGENIYSAYGPIGGDYSYATLSGTSMAAPHVSGVAAMILSIAPEISGAEVKEIIRSHGTPISDGHGNTPRMLDALACVQEAFKRAKGHGTLNLTASNKETKDLVYDVQVSLKPLEICQETETKTVNTGLVYPYMNQLKLGEYEVTVSKDGFRPHVETITVTRDSTIQLNVALQPNEAPDITKGTLNGAVTFNSSGVNNIEVHVLSGSNHVATLITNEAGQFGTDLEPGTYTLCVDADGYVPVSKDVVIFKGKITDAQIELDDGMYASATQSMRDSIYYEVKLFNAKGSIRDLQMKVTLTNGMTLLDTANGISSGVTWSTNGFTFPIDDELAQGASLSVTATDQQGRTYSGSIVLSADKWPGAKRLPDGSSYGGYWDTNGYYHDVSY